MYKRWHKLQVLKACVIAIGFFTIQQTVAAGLSPSTLNNIRSTGQIRLGVRESAPPFSYTLGHNEFVGFSVDLMMRVVDDLKAQLKMPDLKYRFVEFSPQDRTALIQSGRIDLECSSTSITPERQRQVSFSSPFFVSSSRLLVAYDSDIQSIQDLTDKKLATTSGTTSERLSHQYNRNTSNKINIITARDNAEAFRLLESNRADAFMMDESVLLGERATAKHPNKWILVGEPLSKELYGCMLATDDGDFKAIVDRSLADIMHSDEINVLYKKWFERPIPPNNVSLQTPMSTELKTLYAKSADKASH